MEIAAMEFSSGTGVPELMQLGPFEDESQIAAVEAAPVEQRIGVSTIYDAVAASAARHPDRIAVRFLANGLASDSGEDVSYARLLADMTGAANMFRSLGVGEEDVVAVMLPNLPEFYPAVFGACTAGIAFPINYLLEPDQIAALVRASRARVLVTVAPSFDREIWMRAQTVRDAMPDLHVFTVRGEAPGAVPFGGLVPSEALAFQPVRRLDRVVALLHTGGSTGHPKIARQTGRNLLFEAWVLGALRERAADANCVCAGPLFHAAGLVITGVMPLFWGATIVMLSPWGYRGKGVIGDLWKVVDKHKITHLTLVPTVLTVLAGMPFKPVPSLLYIGSGAAPLARALHDKFLGLSGYAVGQGYGMTEAGCAVTTTQHGATPFGSVGRRLPYVRVRIVIVDDGGKEVREANEGELGILAVSGPNVFAGYLGREDDKAT
jgi:fatty-acyl-CoA synthase